MQNKHSFILKNKSNFPPSSIKVKVSLFYIFVDISLMSSLIGDVKISYQLCIHCNKIYCLVKVYEEILVLYKYIVEKK